MQGMETAYVGNGISAENASTTVGKEVIKAVAQKYQTNNQIGKATIEIDDFGTLEEVTGDATVSVYTTDFEVEGTISLEDGNLTWGEIEPNVPSIKIINAPQTLGIGKFTTLTSQIKRVTPTPTISWTSSSNSIATVNTEGKVTGLSEGNVTITAKITVDGVNYLDNCSLTIKEEKYIGKARQADKYGYKVIGYDVKLTEVECWRLFYQDDNNTYLIANKPQGSYKPKDYYEASGETRYTTGASVSEVGRNLNEKYYKAYPTAFQNSNENGNIRALSWMTDTENSLWNKYKDSGGKASWAVASPSIELFVESFNAVKEDIDEKRSAGTTEEAARTAISCSPYGIKGYTYSASGLSKSYNHGIYNYAESGDGAIWWLTSPSHHRYNDLAYLNVDGSSSRLANQNVSSTTYSIRPVVCIPTTIFNVAVTAGTYKLIDE